jgi:hypothetical protein
MYADIEPNQSYVCFDDPSNSEKIVVYFSKSLYELILNECMYVLVTYACTYGEIFRSTDSRLRELLQAYYGSGTREWLQAYYGSEIREWLQAYYGSEIREWLQAYYGSGTSYIHKYIHI